MISENGLKYIKISLLLSCIDSDILFFEFYCLIKILLFLIKVFIV